MSDTMMTMPILALRGMVVFPGQTTHFDVGRSKSVKALETAMEGDQTLFLVPQKNLIHDDPSLDQLYSIGTVVKVKQVLRQQGDNIRVLVTGQYRAAIFDLQKTEPYLSGIVEQVEEIP